jgi:orotidine-5'-phosphate decarboxylase
MGSRIKNRTADFHRIRGAALARRAFHQQTKLRGCGRNRLSLVLHSTTHAKEPAMSAPVDPKSRLFVALDVPDAKRAEALVAQIGDAAACYKIGLELAFGGGIGLAQTLKRAGKQIFLDLKLLDIPNTVEKATANLADLGLDYLTIHGTDRKTLDAAVKGRGNSALKLLAVTVLTSLDASDLKQQGIASLSPADLVLHRAKLAKAAGFDGVIASGQEAAAIRAAVGPGFAIVTPGIRLADGPDGDQARVMTPGRAIAGGASHLVVGRPITEAVDPAAAARQIVAAISNA